MRKQQIWKNGIVVSAAVVLLSQPAFAAIVSSGGPGSTTYTTANQQTTATRTTNGKTTASQTSKTIEGSQAATPAETYNKELGMYEQEFGNGRRMVTSIPNGSQVPDAVYVQVPDNALVRLEVDGRATSFQNGVPITDPGYYVMLVSSTVVGSTTRADAAFRFRILPPPSGRQNTGEYIWPKVVCELLKTTFSSESMNLFVMDNKAGFLTDVPDQDEKVTSAAFFFPSNVNYLITRDGAGISYHNREKLTTPGRYQIKVSAPSQAYTGDYAAFYEATFHFVIPTNADDSLLANSAQPVSGASGAGDVFGNASGSSGSSGSSYSSSGSYGSTYNGDSAGYVNYGSELTYQSDMVQETWKEEAKLYEERFSNGIVFYSNVADSSIVGGGVYLDIPADVGVKIKRDGSEIPFLNKEILNTEGTYLLTLTSNTNLGNDKNIYQSFFHFRIQNGVTMAGAVSPAGASALAAGQEGQTGTGSGFGTEGQTGPDGTITGTGFGTEGAAGGTAGDLAGETAGGLAGENTEGTAGESASDWNGGSGAGSSADAGSGEAGQDAQAHGSGKKPSVTAPPSGEGYDEDQQLFTHTFSDNTVFYASVPQNGISNAPAALYLPEGGKGVINTGEKDVNLPKGLSVDQDGTYHAVITSAGGETCTWDFQVMSHATNSLEEITAPKGYYIDSVVKNDTMLKDSQYTDSYPAAEDGTYTVSFMPYYENYPEWFLAFAKDTVAPVVTFEGLDENSKATGKEVTFTCSDEDAEITLLRGKKKVSVTGNTVSGGGKYTMTAADAAGNQNTYTFQIPSEANLMTVCAILSLFVLALGFATYYKVYGEKFKVR